MNYRSVADLDDQIISWLGKFPSDLEVIVGVPRSGMLVANLLSLHLNLPLTDVEGLLQGRMIQAGARLKEADMSTLLSSKRKILVVDDSVLDGNQLKIVREKIENSGIDHDILYAAPYIVAGKEHLVDFFIEILPTPRCFEWNLMHHKLFLENTCMDIDGVLCYDPGEADNDDGPKYECFVRDAAPLYLPSHPVANLVTCRLEKYRAATEEWLAHHGVRYQRLFMMDYPDMAARRAAGSYASFKADIYLKTRAWLFIESSMQQASQIAELTGYNVFCMETREMISPGIAMSRRRKIIDAPRTIRQTIRAGLSRTIRVLRALGRKVNYRVYSKQ